MREFTSAVEGVAAEDEQETKILALVEAGKTREEAEREVEEEMSIPFKIDGRELRAYYPTDGQLTFLLASMGRGQSQESRFSSIINVMLECLRDEDRDYLEGRLITRDPKRKIPMKVIEEVFEGLVEEWFSDARPTQPSSGSAPSQPNDGQNSPPPTT